MSTALAHAESELSTLRRAYGEQEHHRRHLEGRLQEMLDARTATSAELQDQKHRVEHVER